MKTKILAMFLTLTLVLSMFGGLSVSAENGFIWLGGEEPKPITVLLDGNPLTFDVPPRLINGRTMVPLRAIFEALGAMVYWEEETQTVTAMKDATIVEMTIGNDEMYCSGTRILLDSVPCLIDGRTLVPARAIAESFGMLVGWDEATRTVTIDTPAEQVQEEPVSNVFEAAHRTFRDFILQDGVWDEEVLNYWTSYATEDGTNDVDMYYSARGAMLNLFVQFEGYKVDLCIRFDEAHYPVYALLCEYEGSIYQIVGYFDEANKPGTETENTFVSEDKEGAQMLLDRGFARMNDFVENVVGVSLAQCGIYYEPIQ